MTATPQEIVQSTARAFADAFNAKDAAAVGTLFRDDAEFVNIFGRRFRGREGVVAAHAELFAHALSGNRLVVHDGDVQVLPGGPLLAHVPWTREVVADAGPGLPPGSGLFTFVHVEQDGAWHLAACTNVQDATPPGPPPRP